MTNYLADPGGRFASDTHRRVLGSLSLPTDNYGWTVLALIQRMAPDVGTSITTPDEMQSILQDLEADGHAEKLNTVIGEVWRMTQAGYDSITGPIANEPTADQPSPGASTRVDITATPVNGSGGPAGSSPTIEG